uniref:Uncharacterized protein n=1 Tax=Romanomermis culicivorax TaxID=13658 RepID=A0A915I4S2_ROMCU
MLISIKINQNNLNQHSSEHARQACPGMLDEHLARRACSDFYHCTTISNSKAMQSTENHVSVPQFRRSNFGAAV